METDNTKVKRWVLPKPLNDYIINDCNLSITLQKVLIRRGIDIKNNLDDFLTPSDLPNPEGHFVELSKATKRIVEACNRKEKIAICGDYDADGITSTVLLVELLSKLGAIVIPYIPSRQDEGYGLNINMINAINNKQIKLVITVDNGISAFEAITRANEYGIDLIITDHHKIPEKKSNIYSLIHPELTPNNSPYKYLAGVGIAYLLAKNVCNKLDYDITNTTANVLFCIGTIADMAPLLGANRKWLKESLPKINKTENKGIKSIIKKIVTNNNDISSEDIGYKIAPLINAVGRIGDPKLIINLLTNDSTEIVEKLAKKCVEMNKERKSITALIEQEALPVALNEIESDNKFLVLINKEWHPGVIGIVAARMVDKFNLPTAILSLANDGNFRGSIRSNNKLKLNLALDECKDLLISYGGHSAAAGFSIKQKNISKLKEKLNEIAKREFKYIDLSKTLRPDVHISFKNINFDFYNQLKLLGPFGINNKAPIFWTRKCRVLEIYKLKGGHLKLTINDGTSTLKAIKWNYSMNLKINELIDIAFYIENNIWRKKNTIQLNIIDIKKYKNIIDLQLHNQNYKCYLNENKEVIVTNTKNQSISSAIMESHDFQDEKQLLFAKKILTFAEIALGKAD